MACLVPDMRYREYTPPPTFTAPTQQSIIDENKTAAHLWGLSGLIKQSVVCKATVVVT